MAENDKKDSKGPTEEAKTNGADGSTKVDKSERGAKAEKQSAAAIAAYDASRKSAAAARMKSANLDLKKKSEGPTIEVRTVGIGNRPRFRYVKGGQRFTDKPCEVELHDITFEQYRAIMSAPLLEVKGKAPKDFDGWAKG